MEKKNKIKFFISKIYHNVFIESFSKKINFKFKENISRIDLIQKSIDKNNYKNYLEIGCDDNVNFNAIKVENKIGVDPVSGGNYKDTSDNFFYKNTLNFDCIFIDGLHHYYQVRKDINNSLNCLENNGTIFVHDCLPKSKAHQAVPRYRSDWNGDVWKAIVETRTRPDIETKTVLIDPGIAIIKKQKNNDILKIKKNFSKLKFKDFYENHKKYMRIISYEDSNNFL